MTENVQAQLIEVSVFQQKLRRIVSSQCCRVKCRKNVKNLNEFQAKILRKGKVKIYSYVTTKKVHNDKTKANRHSRAIAISI